MAPDWQPAKKWKETVESVCFLKCRTFILQLEGMEFCQKPGSMGEALNGMRPPTDTFNFSQVKHWTESPYALVELLTYGKLLGNQYVLL